MSKGAAPVSYEPTYRQIAPTSAAETIELLAPGGEIQQVRATQAGTLRALGYKDMTPEIRQQMADQAKYGGTLGELGAAALGGARGLTFGASDVAIRGAEKSGVLPAGSTEDVRKLQEINPMASLGGELASFAVPGLAAVKALGKVGTVAKGIGAAQTAVGEVGTVLGKAAGKIAGEKLGALAAPAAKLAAESAIFQAGHNISEQALADKDLTVEAVMSNLGTAAVLGGGLGVALPLGLRAAKAGALAALESAPVEWVVGPAGRAAAKFLDPQRAVQLYSGAMSKGDLLMDTAKGSRFKQAVKELWDDGAYKAGRVELDEATGRLVQVESGKLPNQAEMLQRVQQLQEQSGTSIGKILQNADDAAASAGVVPSSIAWTEADGDRILGEIQKWRKTRRIDELTEKRLVGEVTDIASGLNETRSLKELHDLRRGLDQRIGGKNFEKIQTGEEIEVVKDIRRLISDKIRAGFGELEESGIVASTEQWNNTNKLFSSLSNVAEKLDYQVARSNANVNVGGLRWRDLMAGTVGASAFGPVGALAGIGNHILQTDQALLARAAVGEKLATLGWLTKATEAAEKGIAKSMSSFVKGVNVDALSQAAVRKFGTKAPGVSGALANQEHTVERRQQTQREWFDKTAAELQMVASDPQGFAAKQGSQLAAMAHSAPQISEMLVGKQMQAYSYLLAAMPKNPTNPMNILNAPWHPADYEIERFADVVKTVREPMSVLADLSAGTLTRAQTKALQTLYPSLYNTMLAEVQKSVSVPGASVPYDKRLQLGMLFPGVESSLNGSFINAMASTNAPPSEKQGGASYSASGASKNKMGSRYGTKTDTLNDR